MAYLKTLDVMSFLSPHVVVYPGDIARELCGRSTPATRRRIKAVFLVWAAERGVRVFPVHQPGNPWGHQHGYMLDVENYAAYISLCERDLDQ
jgi:hypothetical protein